MQTVEITVQGKNFIVQVNSLSDIDEVAADIERAMTSEDLPTEENFNLAVQRAEENRRPEPSFFEKATAIADAGLTTGLNAASGFATGIPANIGALYDLAMSGDFGTYEGARRAQAQSQETMGEYMVEPSSELAGQYIQALEPVMGIAEAASPAFPVGAGVVAGRVRPGTPPKKTNKGGSAGAMQTAQETLDVAAAQERMARMRELGIEGDAGPTAGQLTRNPELQGREGVLRTLGGGDALQRRFDEQNAQLKATVDRGVYDVGAGPDGDYRPMTDVDVGGGVKSTLRESEARSKSAVDDAYDAARNSPEADIPVEPVMLQELINGPDFGRLSIAAQTKDAVAGLKTYLQKSGLGDIDEDGNITLRPATISELEDLRAQVGDFFDSSNPRQRRAGEMIREAIDEQLDEVEGGDLFKAARAERRRHAEEFEEHDFVSRVLGNKGKTSADRIPDEQVAAGVEKLSNAELGRLKAQLLATGESGAASWRQLASQILNNIKERSLSPASRGIDNEPRINTEKLATSLERLDSAGKLDILFGKETAAQLRTLIQVARDLNQPIRGTQNHSGTNNARNITEGMILGFLDAKTGPVGRWGVNKVRQWKTNSEARRLLDGEGMLKSMEADK